MKSEARAHRKFLGRASLSLSDTVSTTLALPHPQKPPLGDSVRFSAFQEQSWAFIFLLIIISEDESWDLVWACSLDIFHFFNFNFYWSIVDLQYCASFSCTTKWFSKTYIVFQILFHYQFSSVQLLSHVWLFATPWIAAHQASLSITNSWSLPKLMSIELVIIQPSHPLLSPSPPASNPSQHQSLFQWVNSSHEVAKVLEFQL